MGIISTLGSTLGLGLVSGINLYITILTVGLGIRFHFIHLPASMSQLDILASPIVLGVAGVMFLIEFFADKIPWVDSIWDAIHSFVRPIGAIVLGLSVVGNVDPTLKIVIILLCGGMAVSSFAAKAGSRIAANFSPEPFSNIGLSLLGDTLATAGAYLSVTHPVLMLAVCVAFFTMFLIFAPGLYRLVRLECAAVSSLVKSWFGLGRQAVDGQPNVENLPDNLAEWASKQGIVNKPEILTRCAAGPGVKGLKNSLGYAQISGQTFTFMTRRMMRFHVRQLPISSIHNPVYKKGFLLDTLTFSVSGRRQTYRFFKDGRDRSEELLSRLESSSQESSTQNSMAGLIA